MGYYNSFVVRIWSDEHGLSRGSIEHVATRHSLIFSDPDTVVAFIRLHLSPPSSDIPDGDTDGRGEDSPIDDGLLE